GSAEKSIIGEPEPVLTGLPTGVPGCAGSPSWQVFPRGQVTPRGSENVVALKTTARRASIWCCAKTRAVPSLRLFEFMSTDVGTSCATATSPTRMITVATSSSIKVKPDWPLVVPRFVNTRLILVSHRRGCQFPFASPVHNSIDPAGSSSTARYPASGAVVLARYSILTF